MPLSAVAEFDYGSAVKHFTASKKDFLSARPQSHFSLVATSSLVFDTRAVHNPRILLLQRAASDSDSYKWEPPGGACDDNDTSILHATARELSEETGLRAARIDIVIGDPFIFTLDDGRRVGRFYFRVHAQHDDANLTVKLNPEEHSRYVWATEAEIRGRETDDIDLVFTAPEVECKVLEAFNYVRGIPGEGIV